MVSSKHLALIMHMQDLTVRNAQQTAMEDAADTRREIQDDVEQQEALAAGVQKFRQNGFEQKLTCSPGEGDM